MARSALAWRFVFVLSNCEGGSDDRSPKRRKNFKRTFGGRQPGRCPADARSLPSSKSFGLSARGQRRRGSDDISAQSGKPRSRSAAGHDLAGPESAQNGWAPSAGGDQEG